MPVQHTASGPGAPTSAPPSIGAHYTDTSTGDQYLAKGTASVADWVKQGAGPEVRFYRTDWTDISFNGPPRGFLAAAESIDAVIGVGYGLIKTTSGFDRKEIIGTGTQFTAVAWSDSLGKGVAMASVYDDGSASNLAVPYTSSSDGETWTAGTMTTFYVSDGALVWAEGIGKFVAGIQTNGNADYGYAYSSDGVNWDTVAGGTGSGIFRMRWIEQLGLLVAMRYASGALEVITSPDAQVWTVAASITAASTTLADIAWSPALGRALISTHAGEAYYCDTETLGTWTKLTIPSGGSGGNMLWIDELSAFVGVGNAGDGKRQGLVSRDGKSVEERVGGGSTAAYTSLVWSAAHKTLFAGASSYLGTGVPLVVAVP